MGGLDYPEHEKLQAVAAESQAIGAFIETGGYTLYEPDFRGTGKLVPCPRSINQILGQYFEIDLGVIEDEKRAMLEALRNPLLRPQTLEGALDTVDRIRG